MRLKAFVLFIILCCLGHGQVWEKYFEPGLTLRVEVDWTTPRTIYAIRFNENSTQISALPSLPNEVVLSETPTKGRGTVSEAVSKWGALGGINADFFPFTGDPLGALVVNGELISHPWPKRSIVAWGDGRFSFGACTWNAVIHQAFKDDIVIDAVNAECGPGQLILNSPKVGTAKLKGPGVMALFKVTEGSFTPNGKVSAIFQAAYSDIPSLPVQQGNLMIVASGPRAQKIREMSPGDPVTFKMDMNGFDWSKKTWAIGGGPQLLKSGKVSVDGVSQGFGFSLIHKRHPRTAIGRTSNGDIWYVVIDGRQSMSAGATLEETAYIMQRLGCIDAINLDGGGSSCMNLFGLAVNRPSEGSERPIADMILFRGKAPVVQQDILAFVAPPQLNIGQQVTLSIKTEAGTVIPNSEIIWSAQGAGWVDQGGMLRGLAAGSVTVKAWVRGQILEVRIPVGEPPKAKKN